MWGETKVLIAVADSRRVGRQGCHVFGGWK